MSCTNPDGTLTESATAILTAIMNGSAAPEQIATNSSLPLFRVRSALRNLSEMGLAVVADGRATLTEDGRKRVQAPDQAGPER
jgi:hypothetical protein